MRNSRLAPEGANTKAIPIASVMTPTRFAERSAATTFIDGDWQPHALPGKATGPRPGVESVILRAILQNEAMARHEGWFMLVGSDKRHLPMNNGSSSGTESEIGRPVRSSSGQGLRERVRALRDVPTGGSVEGGDKSVRYR